MQPLFKAVLTGEAGFNLIPLLRGREPPGAEAFPADGVLEELDVRGLLRLQSRCHGCVLGEYFQSGVAAPATGSHSRRDVETRFDRLGHDNSTSAGRSRCWA